MAFPTAVNDQITDSVTQSNAKVYLGELIQQNRMILQFNIQALNLMLMFKEEKKNDTDN